MMLFFLCSKIFASNAPPEFVLTVTPTDETCFGNGTLTFTVVGIDPGATMIYSVYQMPNEVTAIAVQNEPFLGGRVAGIYKVVATQILGSEANTQTAFATINNAIVPFDYTITSTNSICGDGEMTVIVIAGIGEQYEIISGPVTRPLQSSPVFSNLPAGVYQVRAFNNCGDAVVITHTLLSSGAQIEIGGVSFPDRMLPSCDSIVIANLLTTEDNNVIAYPLSLTYTVYPPGSSVGTVQTQTVATGDELQHQATTTIPFYHGQMYFYDLTVTDNCGNVYTLEDIPVDLVLTAQLTAQSAECGAKYLTLTAATYRPDLTVTFLDAPAGFVPVDFNAGHPGPFSAEATDYGSSTQPVPFGHYLVQIVDGCGNTAQAEVDLTDLPAVPEKELTPYPGCQSNMSVVKITIPGFTIVSAIITIAPAAYTAAPIPDDVTDQITVEDGLVLEFLIEGDYTVELTDDCGNVYIYSFTVPGLDTNVSPLAWPACELGLGSIRISGNSTVLTSVVMTGAPVGYPELLPYNVSFNIGATGVFSMTGLIPGTYHFEVDDNCGQQNIATVNVVGYAITANDFLLTPHCGAFDITFTHVANGVQQSFWLQEFNPATNSWGHPLTGVPYPENTFPNPTNSYAIEANFTTLNLEFLGSFRIIKRFQTMANGSQGAFRDCYEILQEFEFTGEFEIIGFEKVTCTGALADVKVLANGVAPLLYKIIKKNGVDFLIDNGTNNLFTGLENAVYTFTVQQSCGDIVSGDADVAQLPSLANANQPPNMTACDDASGDGIEEFLLTDQNAAILGTQDPADFTISYHSSMTEAQADINPLPFNYNSGNATIYARLEYVSGDQCYDIVSFELIVTPHPVLVMDTLYGICVGGTTTITADGGLISYLWSTGETTQSIVVTEAGQYTLEYVKASPTGNCSGIISIDVVASNAPVIEQIDITDWTDNDNSITVVLDGTGIGQYLYSIDNINFQESNTFTDLAPGPYTVFVKDLEECGLDTEDVYLLTYPKFFTPNGDGINDYWRIKFSHIEPHLKTYVFDRYGKLIIGFMPDSEGWNGTLNGQPLPSTDYWFVVIREDGRHLKGHFAMKR